MCCPRADRCLLLLILLVFICTMAGDTLHGTSTVRISRLVSFHTLILYTARNATRLTPGMAPVLIADAGILATSFMHTHKHAPIAALRCRVPHPWNCRPSALEVILPLHYHSTPHVPFQRRPLNAAHVDMMTVNDLLVLHTVAPDVRRHPALAPAPCTSAIDLVGVEDVIAQTQTPAHAASSWERRCREVTSASR